MLLESPLQWGQKEGPCQVFCSLKRGRNGGGMSRNCRPEQQVPQTEVVRVVLVLSPQNGACNGRPRPSMRQSFTLGVPSPYIPTVQAPVHCHDRVPALSFLMHGFGMRTRGLRSKTRDHRTSASRCRSGVLPGGGGGRQWAVVHGTVRM